MFCPKCGKPDQLPETYCRQCGVFLPDLEKPRKTPITPEDHVKVNLAFSVMTVLACFTFAVLLYSILAFRPDTHWLIYATAGLLTAMGFWHTQTLWRSILLKRHFRKNKRPQDLGVDGAAKATDRLLDEPDLENLVPPSVVDHTTKRLSETKLKSS